MLRRTSLLLSAVALSVAAAPPVAPASVPGANGKIAFVKNVLGSENVYVVSGAGTPPVQLTRTQSPASYTGLAWAPSGSQLAFSASWIGNGTENDIFVVNADGSGRTNLTNHPASDSDPAWSPDGTKIVFTRYWPGDSFGYLYVMNADGSDQVELIQGNVSDPSWSPDGSKIAFRQFDGNSTFNLYVMDADGSDIVQLTDTPEWELDPEWSPDGEKILFEREGVDSEIYVMDPDGSDEANISNHPAEDGSPGWSPDGSAIVFTSSRAPAGVYSMNTDGSAAILVARSGARPDWQPLQVALDVSRSLVTQGASVTATAHLVGFETAANTTVSIYKTPHGGAKTLVATGPVDASGNLTVDVPVIRKTVFTAEWSGDAQRPAGGSDAEVVTVLPLVTGRMIRFDRRSGNYRLYTYERRCTTSGRGCPTYTTGVQPRHAGLRVRIRLQLRLRGSWRNALDVRRRLGPTSRLTLIFVYGNAGVTGIPARVRTEFPGDADHLARNSSWAYFKVTR